MTSEEAMRETVRTALYEGLCWFGTLPEPEGDVPERYHRWDDLGAFADRILAAQQDAPIAQPDKQAVERAAIALAKSHGLDWHETCGYEIPDGDDCDSGTCVAANYEDHDPCWAREQYLRDARAALATIQPAQASDTASRADDGWRDITSAPKDGTQIDLYSVFDNGSTKRGKRLANCRWRNQSAIYETGWHDCFDLKIEWTGDDGCARRVSHWMPLPAAPSGGGDALAIQPDSAETMRALREAELQLRYLDERNPTGTTPTVIARIESAIRALTIGDGK